MLLSNDTGHIYTSLSVIALLVISFCLTPIYAKENDQKKRTNPFGYTKEGTIDPWKNWKYNTSCHKIWIKVTMNVLSGSDRLLCTIEQRNATTGALKYTLWEDYLEVNDDTGQVYTESPQSDDIWVKLTEVDGTETDFEIYIEGEEYTKK
jgi:hypothetical protein